MEAKQKPFELTLEFVRADAGGDPFAFQFTTQEYLLRQADGSYRSAPFAWTERLLSDLAALARPHPDREVAQRLGDRLRDFLAQLDWGLHEARIELALEKGRPTHVTFRFAAAELLALPWECVALRGSGLHLGEIPGCLVQYELAGTRTVEQKPSPEPEGGRLLFAWSTAEGEVPASEHLDALVSACTRGHHPFDPKRDVIENVSLPRLIQALEQSREPIGALHILCHGGRSTEGSYGLVWSPSKPGGEAEIINAGVLRQALAPHASRIRMVVLCACQSGNPGQLDSHLGSLALALHRVGIPAVVASRLPLSVDGSIELTKALYGALLEKPASLQQAVMEARRKLGQSATHLDWASLQLYARAEDGSDFRPFIFRPYRGLLAFQPEHRRFFFGREQVEEVLVRRVNDALEGRLPRFQVVAGTSGCGKSSLVLAGLVPALGSEHWDTLVMRPSVAKPQDVIERATQLRKAQPKRRLLLVVDQFEEIFTQVPTLSERQALLGALWALAQAEELGVVVLATLRVDYFERCAELGVCERLDEVVYSDAHRLFVSQLHPRQLEAVIERPARAVGLDFDDGLVASLCRDAGQELGALPLLEYALDLLWERREGGRLKQKAYEQMDGATGALTQTVDHLYEGLTPAEQRQARRVLVELVDFGSETSPNTRRRVWVDRVRPAGEKDRQAFDAAVEKLVGRRLLVQGSDPATTGEPSGVWIEIAHEALIRRWERLGKWLEEDRELALQLREIQGWAKAWKAGRRDLLSGKELGYARQIQEKHSANLSWEANELVARSVKAAEAAERRERRRQRTLSVALGAMTTALLCVAGVATYASIQREEARTQQRRFQELAKRIIAASLERIDPVKGMLVLQELQNERNDLEWEATALKLLQQPPAQVLLIEHGRPTRIHDISQEEGFRLRVTDLDNAAPAFSLDPQRNSRFLRAFSSPLSSVKIALFSPDGRLVLTASDDGTARISSVDGSSEALVLENHSDPVRAANFSPDGHRIVTASHDGTARVWSADVGSLHIVLKGHSGPITAAVFSSDGRRILTSSVDGTACVWSADGESAPLILKSHSAEVLAAAFSPDGRRVVTASSDGTARIWDADLGSDLLVLRGHTGSVRTAVFSPDSRQVVTASSDGTARIWSADASSAPIVLRGHAGPVLTAVFSPDGRHVVTSSNDGTSRVWPADGVLAPLVLEGHSGPINTAAFSPDGRFIITSSDDGTARVWSAEAASEPLVLKGHSGSVNIAAFSPDGRQVVTGSADGTARVWSLRSAPLPQQLREASPLCLTPEQRQRYLQEDAEAAESAYERCERGRGRVPLAPSMR